MDQPTLKGFMFDYKDFIDHVEAVGTAWVGAATIESSPPWGLDRIDQLLAQPKLDQKYTWDTARDGSGVHVYVVDTGIRATHQDFRYPNGTTNAAGVPLSRIGPGVNLVNDGQGTNDCHGHGTHCAGIVGGVWSGVAKEAIIHPVRTMDCNGSGTYDAIVGGLDWIGQNYQLPGVVSMSLTTPASPTLDAAVASLVNLGLVVVAAAGNYHADACGYSPARSSAVISVQSSNVNDQQSSFSNYGACTTLFAPGEVINSCGIYSDISIVALSGTSMACPAVAGAAAVYLSQNPSARPTDVTQAILDASQAGAISVTSDTASPTRLLNVNMQTPNMAASPRTIVQPENSQVKITFTLKSAPRYNVVVNYALGDTSLGSFSESSKFFTPTTWNTPVSVTLTLPYNQDFLDHTTPLTFTFLSKDPGFNKVLSGQLTVQDTDVCRTCGGTLDYPKVIPRLPFYQEGTTHFSPETVKTATFSGSCGGGGPNMIYMLIPPWDMTLHVQLCNSQFDTVLTVLKRTGKTSAGIQTVLQACNDDSCNIQSAVYNVPVVRNTLYYFVFNGYAGDNGPYGINVTSATPPPAGQSWPAPKPIVAPPTTASLTTAEAAILAESNEPITLLSVDPPGPVVVDGKLFTKWNTMGALQLPSIDAPLFSVPTGPSWSASDWGECSVKCGGGKQIRTVACLLVDGTPAATSTDCDASVRPAASQSCNPKPCLTYSVYTSPWSECSASCGGGTQYRLSHCQDQFGDTAAPEMCGLSSTDSAADTRACNVAPCSDYYFSPGPWSVCNAPCQWGHATRDVPCIQRATNATVDPSLCYGVSLIGFPVASFSTEKSCNTQPCGAFAWMFGPWGTCQAGPGGCHNGTQSRLVECVDSDGNSRAPETCSELPAPASSAPCSTLGGYCDPCEGGRACSGHGACDGSGTCTCQSGWTGPVCDLPTSGACANGRPDAQGSCCLSGVLDSHGTCCLNSTRAGAPFLVDGFGRCCPSGAVDACGVCGGSGRFVDSTGVCCATTRDESGVCCESGQLDECFVCDGDGTSCASAVSLILTLTTPLSGVNATDHLAASFAVGVSSALGVAKRAINITGFVGSNETVNVGPGASQMSNPDPGVSQSRPFAEYIYIDLTVQPVGMSDSSVVGRGAAVAAALEGAFGGKTGTSTLQQMGFPDGVLLESVDPVLREGICGNGVCEIGERCTPLSTSASRSTNDSAPCCYKDCPYVAQPCPLALTGPFSGQLCGARGRCLDATGTCDCFEGHAGSDCSACVEGYVPTASGLCVKPAVWKNTTLASLDGGSGSGGSGSGAGGGAGGTAAAGGSSTGLIVGLVVGLGGAAIIVAVVAGTVFVVKKTRARGRSPAVAAATASVSPLTAAVPETSSQAEKDGKKPIETSTSAEEPHVEGTEAASPRATPQLNRNSPETTNMQQ